MSTEFWAGFRKGCIQGTTIGLVLVTIWLFVAIVVYAFRHPHQTDVERFLHIPEALRFE